MDLPKKREYILYAPLVSKQIELYEATLKGELREIISKNVENHFKSVESFDSVDSSDLEVNESNNDTEEKEEAVENQENKPLRSSKRGRIDYKEKSDRSYFKSLENQKNLDSIPKEFVEQDTSGISNYLFII